MNVDVGSGVEYFWKIGVEGDGSVGFWVGSLVM